MRIACWLAMICVLGCNRQDQATQQKASSPEIVANKAQDDNAHLKHRIAELEEQTAHLRRSVQRLNDPGVVAAQSDQTTSENSFAAQALMFIVLSKQFTPDYDRRARERAETNSHRIQKPAYVDAIRAIARGSLAPFELPNPISKPDLPIGTIGAPPGDFPACATVLSVISDDTARVNLYYSRVTEYPEEVVHENFPALIKGWETAGLRVGELAVLPSVVELVENDPLTYRVVSLSELAPYLDGEVIWGLK